MGKTPFSVDPHFSFLLCYSCCNIMENSARDQLQSSLQELIAKTEEIYLNMARRFPQLSKELEQGFEESRQVVAYFTSDQDQAENEEGYGLVSAVIDEAKKIIAEASSFFKGMHERDENLFDAINGNIQHLSNLEEIIENIREDSIEMELISLNAMTAALKAGSAGKAFSYITEELKKLATYTINYTAELTGKGEAVQKFLVGFRETVEGIRRFQGRFFGDFKEKLNSCFDTYNQGVRKLAQILFDVIDEAGKVKKPLSGIMEEVQLQDIIRQSVDHVIISLQETDHASADGSIESRLDSLTFLEQIPALCINVLVDVRENIEKSLATFRENFTELRQTLQSVVEQQDVFLQFFTADDSEGSEEGALTQMFAESVSLLEELLSGIDNSMKEKKKVNLGGRRIVENLRVLQESFKDFYEIIDRFYSIEVASKIEVAKEESLMDRQGTVEEMTRLTSKIESDVEAALATIKESLERTNKSIGGYSREIEGDFAVVENMRKEIQQAYKRLMFSKNTLEYSLSSFSVFTNHLF